MDHTQPRLSREESRTGSEAVPSSSRPDGITPRPRPESPHLEESAYENKQSAHACHIEPLSQVAQVVVGLGEELIGKIPHQGQASEAQANESQSGQYSPRPRCKRPKQRAATMKNGIASPSLSIA